MIVCKDWIKHAFGTLTPVHQLITPCDIFLALFSSELELMQTNSVVKSQLQISSLPCTLFNQRETGLNDDVAEDDGEEP